MVTQHPSGPEGGTEAFEALMADLDQPSYVVTAADGDERAGCLVGFATQCSIEPPRFAVTTATMYFPTAAGRARVCMPCVRGEGHRLRHRVLGPEKDRLVAAIAEAPRGSIERSVLFHEMHHRLNAAARHPAIVEWERNLEETERHEREEACVFDRELFYAIQPAERLESLITYYRNAFEV